MTTHPTYDAWKTASPPEGAPVSEYRVAVTVTYVADVQVPEHYNARDAAAALLEAVADRDITGQAHDDCAVFRARELHELTAARVGNRPIWPEDADPDGPEQYLCQRALAGISKEAT